MDTLTVPKGMQLSSKHENIKNDIQARIRKGLYHGKIPGVRDLADEYGVNVKTIQKAVASLIREGILSARVGQGSFVTETRHFCIGITAPPIEQQFFFKHEYYGSVFEHILNGIQHRGDFFAYQQKRPSVTYGQLFRKHYSIDGMLVYAITENDEDGIHQLHKRIPTIVIGTTFEHDVINYVDSENEEDSRKATSLLVKRGHKNILFICDGQNSATRQLRLRGYRKALTEHRLEPDDSHILMSDDFAGQFRESLLAVFTARNAPTAVFGANCFMTCRALDILKERSADLDVVVYDDWDDALALFGIPYTAVVQPTEEIGRVVIEKLYGLMQGSITGPVQIRLPSKLVMKQRRRHE